MVSRRVSCRALVTDVRGYEGKVGGIISLTTRDSRMRASNSPEGSSGRAIPRSSWSPNTSKVPPFSPRRNHLPPKALSPGGPFSLRTLCRARRLGSGGWVVDLLTQSRHDQKRTSRARGPK